MKKAFFLLSCLFFSGCSNEYFFSYNDPKNEILLPTSSQPFQEISMRNSTTDEIRIAEEFAYLLAISLKNINLRIFLKNEAKKKFDGDYDILVSKISETNIGNEKFSNLLKNNTHVSAIKANDTYQKAISNKKLNISIPILIDKWETANKIPLVAVSIGAVENETQYLKAFDYNGKPYLINAMIEPDVPVIVIGNNERMGYNTPLKEEKKSRVSGNLEKISILQCPNLNAIEGWFNGGPEIRFDGVVYNDSFSAAYKVFSKMQTPPRDLASLGYFPNQNLFEWYFDDNHGPDYYIQSSEIDDSGSTSKITLSVSAGKKDNITGTASYELNYKAQDKILAGELIHYTSSTPKEISDSNIIFILTN